MGEWKRIFLDRRRILILSGITLISLALFLISLIGDISPGAVTYTVEAARYAKGLTQKWQTLTIEEAEKAAKAEDTRLANYNWWVRGYFMPDKLFESDAEADASVADLPRLVGTRDNPEDFDRLFRAYSRWRGYVTDEIDYILGYGDYLEKIGSQAQAQSQTVLFGKTDSYSYRNLQKTAEDFSVLDGVELKFGENIGIESWLNFTASDYFFLLAVVVFVLSLFEERKRGLWSVVRSCKLGRFRLGLTRIAIIFAASALSTLMIYGVSLAVSMSLNGGFGGLDRSLQSLESFRTCTLRITVGEWLVRYFTAKVMSGALIGLLLWCIIGTVSNAQFTVSVLGGILVTGYMLYEFLPVQSAFNIVKYFNIFSYVHTSDLYMKYLNIDLFGYPVGIRRLMFSAMLPLILILSVWAMLIQCRRYPMGNRDWLSKLNAVFNGVADVVRCKFSVSVWEVYKTLVYEYGIVIVIIVLVLSGSLSYSVSVNEPQMWYQAYLSDMEGRLDESADGYLERARSNIAFPNADNDLALAVDRLEVEVTRSRDAAKDGGYEPWLVDEKVYDSFYGSASRDKQRFNATAAIVFTVFCCAAIAAYERQSDVLLSLRTFKYGRGALFTKKVFTASLMTVFVWAAVYMREFVEFIVIKSPVTLSAPVQNIEALSDFPFVITFGGYLVLLYAARLIMLICVASVTLLISSFSPNVQTAYIAGMGLLGFPAVLTILGTDALKFISPLIPVSSAELMWSIGGGQYTAAIPWIIMLVVGTAAFIIGKRKWIA